MTKEAQEVIDWIKANDSMALRDRMAAHALTGILSNDYAYTSLVEMSEGDQHMPVVAEVAYKYADAMLVERNKRKNQP